MKKAYVVGGVLVVVIVGGVLIWKPVQRPEPAQKEHVELLTNTPREEVNQPPTGTASMTKTYSSPPALSIDPAKTYTATIVTTDGTMNVSLFAKDTPVTVNNFVFLARAGFYTNTTFHRVIKGFMIQGGDPRGDGTGGPGYRFVDEPVTREYTRGTIAMANSGSNTNGSQFFIMHQDYALPKQYVIFGAINIADSASLATLDAIANTPVTDNGRGENSKPVSPPMVQSIEIKEE